MQQLIQIYEFGEFRLDATERRLLRGNQLISLTPKAFDTLLMLVKRSGHVVEKDEMLKEVWPDTFVEEATLAQNIFTLRKALGQVKDGSLYIETVPKRGYRFVASVREVHDMDAVLVVEKHTRTEIVTEEETEVGASADSDGRGDMAAVSTPNGWPALFGNTGSTVTVVELAKPPGAALASAETARSSSTTFSTWADPRGRLRLRLYFLVGFALLIATALGLFLWQREKGRQRATAVAVKSIAVLPFKPLDADSGNELLGLGMADAIIIKLNKYQRFPVLPTSTIIKYSGRENDPQALGQALGVDAVLNGTVQRSGSRVRVTVQLLSIGNGATVWSDKFDEQFTNIFALQDSISEQVTYALALQLTGDEKRQGAKRSTENTEAYQAYLMGLSFWNKRTREGLDKAVYYFQQAIDKDPNYALAYALLADSYQLIAYYRFNTEPSSELLKKAKAAATRALELDDTLAEAHTAMASIQIGDDADTASVEKSFKRAIALNPNYAIVHVRYGWFLSFKGSLDDVLREMRRAQELDPLSPTTNGALAGALIYARQYDEVIKYSQRALELEPNSYISVLNLGIAYEQKGMYDQAIATYQKALELNSENWEPLAALGHVYAVAGREAEAEKMLLKLHAAAKRDKEVFYSIALIYAALGDKDRAFDWFEKVLDGRAAPYRALRFDPDLDILRADPRYAELLKRHGLSFLLPEK
ncbi:MAG TPA: tetratricopeptide repeat protein [Pyrinomonadaceae bacterium]|jgi:DNA-binding winged helix-turn-helix (wHTH) protein/TolB-like protein/Flp pilus assembly protein TadD|nr:tetratricopeptide repeat protein [Pyrinomonadaceae bacterium]